MGLKENIKTNAAKLAIKNPYLWNCAWKCLNTFSFLLPHDNSYWALRHFCYSDQNFFLDIGANSGISALSFRKITKEIKNVIPILSIEPNKLHYKSLLKLEKKIAPFSFIIQGMGDLEDHVDFYTPIYNKIALHTFTSTSQEQVYETLEKSFGKKTSQKIKMEKIIVKIKTIDSLGIFPTIIKIDTEGSDYKILLGAQKTIQKIRPFFMIEACWTSYLDIADFFTEKSYDLFSYRHQEGRFIPIKENQVNITPEGRNIFAIPVEKKSKIPLK